MDILTGLLASIVVAAIWPGNKWLCTQCIEAAVRQLPKDHRDTMREEWHAELAAYPKGIWSLLWAFDLVRGASIRATELMRAGSPTRNVVNLRAVSRSSSSGHAKAACHASSGSYANLTVVRPMGSSDAAKFLDR